MTYGGAGRAHSLQSVLYFAASIGLNSAADGEVEHLLRMLVALVRMMTTADGKRTSTNYKEATELYGYGSVMNGGRDKANCSRGRSGGDTSYSRPISFSHTTKSPCTIPMAARSR